MRKKELDLNKNEDHHLIKIGEWQKRLKVVYQGGGKNKIVKHHSKGKMTARERIEYLVDNPKEVMELGAFAGYDMYPEYGGCPSGGVVTVVAKVNEKMCVIIANDATVKAGAWFPITGKKNLRAQEIALENELPLIYLVDSAGVFLPLQDEIFPDKEHFGRIFRNNAQLSAKGIPQIAAIMGSCVAGGAYLPIMSDEALIVEGTGSIYLAGPYLVKAAIGEDVDNETLGGADTHCDISGVTDYKVPDDKTCLDTIKELIDKSANRARFGFNRAKSKAPLSSIKEIIQHFPSERAKPYDTHEILKRLTDESKYTEYKKDFGKTIICAYSRIDGWSVGIVANNRAVVKNAKKEMQFGGVIYSDSADKAARFIMNCNQKKIPIVFLQDVTGFMVGTRSEHGGIIKDGAKMVSAVSNSTVPKITIVLGNSYGAGNYAMCGKAYDPRFIAAWPSAKIAVMGGEQAAKVLTQIQVASKKNKGEVPAPEEEKALFEKIKSRYDEQTTPYYAAARLWVDAIIDPRNTRQFISTSIEAADHGKVEKFHPGVIQT